MASDRTAPSQAGTLIHILINKIDEEIESHTDYRALADELAKELSALNKTVNDVLHPYEARYTGATLISMKNKQIYSRAINDALRSVYSAFHERAKRKKGVIAMRAYWILPNRAQKDDLLASDGETILPLRQILDPKLRPEGFSHGVPAELLEKCGPKAFAEILFAQRFPAWNGDKQLFSVSTPPVSTLPGRVVHLGLLFLLEPNERPEFELPYASLSKEDRPYAKVCFIEWPMRVAIPGRKVCATLANFGPAADRRRTSRLIVPSWRSIRFMWQAPAD